MSIATELNSFTSWAIICVSAVATLTDLWRGRIYNWLTLGAMLVGLVAGFWFGGLGGLGDAGLGLLLGLLLYGWLFFTGAMGGGDVKLLMSFGALGGARYVLHVAVLGLALGGVLAVLILLFRRRLGEFVRKLHRFVLSVLIRELSLEVPRIDHSLQMPYGPAIASAAVWVLLDNPLLRWGIHL